MQFLVYFLPTQSTSHTDKDALVLSALICAVYIFRPLISSYHTYTVTHYVYSLYFMHAGPKLTVLRPRNEYIISLLDVTRQHQYPRRNKHPRHHHTSCDVDMSQQLNPH